MKPVSASTTASPSAGSLPPLPPPWGGQVVKFFKLIFYWTVVPILVIIFVFFLDQWLFSHALKQAGIVPRDLEHLGGILLSPFVHANTNHLVGNIISLWTLLFLLAIFYKRYYWVVLIGTILLSGSLTWLIANKGIHIGSSGVIYGLAAFIFFSGFIQKRLAPISASVLIFFAYRYLITGLFPQQASFPSDISYSSHWSGVISGILLAITVAYWSKRRLSP